MTLFLDASVLLAACGSDHGASYWLILHASSLNLQLLTSRFALDEVHRNLSKLPPVATKRLNLLFASIKSVEDVLTTPHAVVFSPAKDRPILLTAFANAEILLTLDRQDFSEQIGSSFYSLRIMTPADLIRALRELRQD